jgi:hypothetical protein
LRLPRYPPLEGRLAFNWLTPTLAIGGEFASSDGARVLRDYGISHVVDLRGETCHDCLALRRAGITLLHLPTPDKCAIDPDQLRLGVDWVARAHADGRRVLVHCQYGIGRSALLALCVLVQQGFPPLEALILTKNAREVVSPSPDQLQRFILFSRESWRPDAGWAIPSFEALATIAYRHLAR